MARTISKTLTITRVSYKTAEVVNGEARFVDHNDAIFSGLLEKDKAERMLRAQLGKDAMIVITNMDAGQHRFVMDLETFILNAQIADGELAEFADSNSDGVRASDPASINDTTSEPAPVPASGEEEDDGVEV